MEQYTEVIRSFRNDRFATEAAKIEIVAVNDGYAVCKMPITPLHKNGLGAPMGGAIFTLADFTASVAANTRAEDGTAIVSLQSDIRFLATARGQTLIATSRCVKHGKSTTLYTVEVADELGTQVAFAAMNGYCVKR